MSGAGLFGDPGGQIQTEVVLKPAVECILDGEVEDAARRLTLRK
jgi:hypothetical protein